MRPRFGSRQTARRGDIVGAGTQRHTWLYRPYQRLTRAWLSHRYHNGESKKPIRQNRQTRQIYTAYPNKGISMGNRNKKAQRWKETYGGIHNQSFVMMRHDLLASPLFQRLSGNAQKVFNYLLGQYKGSNNGNLSCTNTQAAPALGISEKTLYNALKELKEAGLILVSREGYKKQCALYALSCFPINEGKHTLKPTSKAPDNWKRKHYEIVPPPPIKPVQMQ